MQRRPTLEDVARRAGVSRALVSIVMRDAPGASEHTRERVRQAAGEIGYRPDARARLLRQQRSKLIGVTFEAGQEFHAELVDQIYVAAEALGYDVVLSGVTPHHDERRALRTLVDDRCEGLLLVGSQLPGRDLVELSGRLPVAVLTRRVRAVDAVRSDDAAGAAMAVEHLVALGHRAILYLDGGRAPGATERLRGYRRAIRAAALDDMVWPGGLTEREGAAAALAMLESIALPSAVFAFNDRCALGVLDVFIRSGVEVPQQVSIVGFDDSPLARLAHVDLTTIRQDSEALARVAVAQLVTRLEEPDGPSAVADLVRQPSLIVRGSTAVPMADLHERQKKNDMRS